MADREKVIKGIDICLQRFRCGEDCPYYNDAKSGCMEQLREDTLALLKEQQSLLGIQQTADSITFLSTGTAQVGEKRGILLGKLFMHEWLEKKLLYSGLLTDEIRAVFDEAKQI